MRYVSLNRFAMVALSMVGSAILLFSCGTETVVPSDITSLDEYKTEHSENLSIFQLENETYSYLFEAPLMEGYSLARDPYREFNKGIHIITYDEDSVGMVKATLTANYAINYQNRKLWEVKGDVVVVQTDGKKLYTSQLFWNQATHRIYSNVDSKLVNGEEIFYGEGFESDEAMHDWSFRKMTGVTYFEEKEPTGNPDSLAAASTVEQTKVKESNSTQVTKGRTTTAKSSVRITKAQDARAKSLSTGASSTTIKKQEPKVSKNNPNTQKSEPGGAALKLRPGSDQGTALDINQLSRK